MTNWQETEFSQAEAFGEETAGLAHIAECKRCRIEFEKEREGAFAAGAASRDAEIAELKALIPPLTEEIADAFIEGAKQESRREVAELFKKEYDWDFCSCRSCRNIRAKLKEWGIGIK